MKVPDKLFRISEGGNWPRAPFKTISVGLELPREELYARINRRVDGMMKAGLLDEVRSLSAFRHLPALKTVGYAELFGYLNGQLELDEAIGKIKQNSRRYAKRQFTWFKKNPATVWFHPTDLPGILDYLRGELGFLVP